MTESNYQSAIKWFMRAADQGHVMASYNLGLLYHHGLGTDRNDGSAVTWWLKAATAGHPGSQMSLGIMYMDGKGVMRDNVNALKWLSLAQENGIAEAKPCLEKLMHNMSSEEIQIARVEIDTYHASPRPSLIDVDKMRGFYVQRDGDDDQYRASLR